MAFKNRIKELRVVKAADIKTNAKNWRTHPEHQRSALRAMLEEVGMVTAVIVREIGPDSYELVDGHLRRDLASDTDVPVIVTDLSEKEADRVLTTFDPLGDLAGFNAEALKSLVLDWDKDPPENAELRRMVADIHDQLAEEETTADGAQKAEQEREVHGMALQPHEHYDYLVVLCTNTQEWNNLADRLGLAPELRRGRMGTCRAIRASRLMPLLKE